MKPIHSLFSSLMVLLQLSATPSFAGKESGGGDAISREFFALARITANLLTSKKLSLTQVDPAQFNHIVENMKVETKENVYLEEVEVDAINYPAALRIELGRRRWESYSFNYQRRLSIVIHEILSLMNLPDKQYVISDQILAETMTLSQQTLESMALGQVDEACGDRWCESDFNFRFHSLKFDNEKGALLKFVMIEQTLTTESELDDKFTQPSVSTEIQLMSRGRYTEYEGTCRFSEFKSPDAIIIVKPASQGGDAKLTSEFLDSVSECLNPAMEHYAPGKAANAPKLKTRPSIIKPKP